MARNLGASVNARLKNIAKAAGEDMGTVQVRYAMERLLWRLTRTSWGDRIALKGALIFVAHFGDVARPTSDIDVNGEGQGSAADLMDMVREAIAVECDDGVEFLAESLEVRADRDWSVIGGGKVALDARIDTSVVRIRVDAGFGNVVTPEAAETDYPTMLPDMPSTRVKVYPFEAMVAEKVDALARQGAETTRLRDYYDLWALSERRPFDGELLARAMRLTFEQTGRAIPERFDALSDDFVELSGRQWDRFRKGRGLRFSPPGLAETVERIAAFVGPAAEAAAGRGAPGGPGRWEPGRGWGPVPAPFP